MTEPVSWQERLLEQGVAQRIGQIEGVRIDRALDALVEEFKEMAAMETRKLFVNPVEIPTDQAAYIRKLENAVRLTWPRFNQFGFSCHLCMGKYAMTEKHFTHAPDCIVPRLLEESV